ncbi:SprT family zinc-dependent metalloprotease [Reinekea sp.]|jgi:predicted metal-dependent hydrolase|uniref:M48 family metallopeptidase n=1 Tax=Reinekea sp. TaxID=1970455 RepID=UPI002A841C72|nr:SprT family zinc-dependent metalloprotease [Reinekea sp.]
MTEPLFWQQLPVKLTYSRRKTIALHVKDSQIEIRAPLQTPDHFVQDFLATKTPWLEKTLAQQQLQVRQRVDYCQASHIPFMGFNVQLIRAQARRASWQLDEAGLKCYLPGESDNAVLPLLNDFYQHQARFWLVKKTHALAHRLNLQMRLSDIGFRNTKTQWGHCTNQGRIQYNWQIMMAPESVIDYLVAHEVCHLQHLNHSSAFWQLVHSAHPTYNQDRRWLRDNGHRLKLI